MAAAPVLLPLVREPEPELTVSWQNTGLLAHRWAEDPRGKCRRCDLCRAVETDPGKFLCVEITPALSLMPMDLPRSTESSDGPVVVRFPTEREP